MSLEMKMPRTIMAWAIVLIMAPACKNQSSTPKHSPEASHAAAQPGRVDATPLFLLESRPQESADVTAQAIFCRTDIPDSHSKTLQITGVAVTLAGEVIEVIIEYRAQGKKGSEVSRRTHWRQGSFSRYRELRQAIFEKGLAGLNKDQLRYLIRGSFVFDRYLFTDCSLPGF